MCKKTKEITAPTSSNSSKSVSFSSNNGAADNKSSYLHEGESECERLTLFSTNHLVTGDVLNHELGLSDNDASISQVSQERNKMKGSVPDISTKQ